MIELPQPEMAYQEPNGPILLLAGPGTGKTWQLAHRTKFLIEDLDVNPSEISIITFTNEAARNMRERLHESDIGLPSENIPENITTMHSLCNSIIGYKPELIGLSTEYTVITDDYSKKVLMKDAATLSGFERKNFKDAADCRGKGSCTKNLENDKCQICDKYVELLRKCLLIDFDDQIYLACELLKNNPGVLEYWQSKSKYLLVDEYQDINEAQCELIQQLSSGQDEGLFVVGDDDQSIYSFRGGSPHFIQNFENYYGKDAKIGRLFKSWRCPENILKGAKSVIADFYKDSVNKPEPFFSDLSAKSEKIKFFDVPTEKREAGIISNIIEEKLKDNTISIIIPNRKYLPPIKKALRYKKIPYTYKSKINEEGILSLLLLYEWTSNKNNNIRLRQILEKIIENYDELIKSSFNSNDQITKKRNLASCLIANLWKEVNSDNSLWEILCIREDDMTLYSKLKRECLDEISSFLKKESIGKRENLSKFLELGSLTVAPGKNPKNLLSEIEKIKNDLIDSHTQSSYLPVNIYNIHSSKGLEGDIIMVVGVSDELIPSLHGDIVEQSRLFYVAMTRAKKELFLFSARTRPASITFHPASYQLKKSRFVKSIPKEHIEKEYILPS